MIVQGFGNVGSPHRAILSRLGVSTIAVGDHTGYLLNPEGFNPHKLQEYVKKNGSIAGYPAGKPISREEFFKIKADIFVPAPSRTRSASRRRRRCRSSLVAEGANGPCTRGREGPPRARHRHPPRRARQRGRRHGQLLRVGAEQAQRELDLEEVDERLERAMKPPTTRSWTWRAQKKCSLRIAAYAVALQRIAQVYVEREIFP
jgi:glutamate dehydrogenase (NAD(P)+)